MIGGLLQIPFCKMPELFLPSLGLSGLLPKFVGADANLFVCGVCHRRDAFETEKELRRANPHTRLKQFGILMLPMIQDRRMPDKAARRNLDCLRHEHLPHCSCQHLFCL